jgi:hypothetical protein
MLLRYIEIRNRYYRHIVQKGGQSGREYLPNWYDIHNYWQDLSMAQEWGYTLQLHRYTRKELDALHRDTDHLDHTVHHWCNVCTLLYTVLARIAILEVLYWFVHMP